jgi:diguanylate cyclase (GGDEF)-like protein
MSDSVSSQGSLQARMALFFLLLLIIIVIVTLLIVRSSTYEHSTMQLRSQLETSASVVQDKVNNSVTVLRAGLTALSKDFATKTLIATAGEDKDSLRSAMSNFQTQRLNTDIYWVLDDKLQILVSSTTEGEIDVNATNVLRDSSVHWYQHQGVFYLMQAVPVKFVELSTRINAWIVMGIKADRVINQDLVKLTDMNISIFNLENNILLSSTYESIKNNSLSMIDINVQQGLHKFTLNNESYIYSVSSLGDWSNSPVYAVLAKNEDKAYLSNQILIEQLIKVLILAGVLALLGAVLLSRSITRPLEELIKVAQDISNGKYSDSFPKSNTREVETLSTAISDMQSGIFAREKEINHLAFFDELTALPNRLQFSQYVERNIRQHPLQRLTVVTLDIDRFKEINDAVSHEIGDRLLILIAQRLSSFLGEHPMLARMGGDEFGIACNQMDEAATKSIGAALICIFEQVFTIDELVLDIDCSIGIAVYPEHASTHQEVLQCADIAMYSCKSKHYRCAVYQSKMNQNSVMRLSLMSELKHALVAGQLQLFYQPKLSIQANKIETAECLIRWFHPEHGFVSPDEFIPLAEQTGAIRHVTHWALNVACQQLQTWRTEGITIGVAVNISAMDLVDMGLPAYLNELLSRYNIAPGAITLEVTESAVMNDPENALRALNTLRQMGVTLSIDDFGTGYSSMAQLKKMPVDELKIDKAFVLDLASNKEDQIMVKTLISLAHNLSLSTVAEGVEDQATLAFLQQAGCTKAQGFYLSKALPAEQFTSWYHHYNKALSGP